MNTIKTILTKTNKSAADYEELSLHYQFTGTRDVHELLSRKYHLLAQHQAMQDGIALLQGFNTYDSFAAARLLRDPQLELEKQIFELDMKISIERACTNPTADYE